MNTLRARLLAAVAYVLARPARARGAVRGQHHAPRRGRGEGAGRATRSCWRRASPSGSERGSPPGARRAGGERRPRAGRRRRLRAAVSSPTGRRPPAREVVRGRPEIASVLATGATAQGRRRSDTLDEELLYTAVPVVDEGVRIGAVRVTRSVDLIDARVRRDVLARRGSRRGARARPRARLASRRLACAAAEGARGDGAAPRPGRPLRRAPRRRAGGAARRSRRCSTRWRTGSAASSRHSASSSPTRPISCARPRQACGSGSRPSLQTSDPELEAELAAAEREVERLARMLDGAADPRPRRGVADAGPAGRSPPRPIPRATAGPPRPSARGSSRWSTTAGPSGRLPRRRTWRSCSTTRSRTPSSIRRPGRPCVSSRRRAAAPRRSASWTRARDWAAIPSTLRAFRARRRERRHARRASGSRSSGRSRSAGAATRRSATRPAAARAEVTFPAAAAGAAAHGGARRGDRAVSAGPVVLLLLAASARAALGLAGLPRHPDTIAIPVTSVSAGDEPASRRARRRPRPRRLRRRRAGRRPTIAAATTTTRRQAGRRQLRLRLRQLRGRARRDD